MFIATLCANIYTPAERSVISDSIGGTNYGYLAMCVGAVTGVLKGLKRSNYFCYQTLFKF